MSVRQIKPVANNQQKYATYRKQMERYARAKEEGFYFEAMLIDYAMLEDRLRSFLYHLGLLDDRKAIKMGKMQSEIMDIVNTYKLNGKTADIGNLSLGGKLQKVYAIVQWASFTDEDVSGNTYKKALKSQIEGIDSGALLEAIKEIDSWKNYRNEIIHSLMNKNLESLDEKLVENVEKGMALARLVDKELRKVKKGGKIRLAAGLKV